jgi:hypothetical protein
MEECTGLERTGLRESVFAMSVCSVSDIDKLRKACFTVPIFLLHRGMLSDELPECATSCCRCHHLKKYNGDDNFIHQDDLTSSQRT